jgi:hypothetical protein
MNAYCGHCLGELSKSDLKGLHEFCSKCRRASVVPEGQLALPFPTPPPFLESEENSMPPLKKYVREPVTEEDKKRAADYAQKIIKLNGYNNLPKILAILVLENIQLVKEVNEHRAPLGIEPMEVQNP